MGFTNTPDWAKQAIGGQSVDNNQGKDLKQGEKVSTIKVRDLQRGSVDQFKGRKNVTDSRGRIMAQIFPASYVEPVGFTSEDRANLIYVVEMLDKIWNHLQSLTS